MVRGLVETRAGLDADVLLEGDDVPVRVPVISLSPETADRWWWPRPLPLRIAVITLLFTALGSAATVATLFDRGSSRSTAGERQQSSITTAQAGKEITLESALQVRNDSWGHRRGASILADATDRLAFELRIRNTGTDATPALTMQPVVFRANYGDAPRPVVVLVGINDEPASLRIGEVQIRPQSGGLHSMFWDLDSFTLTTDETARPRPMVGPLPLPTTDIESSSPGPIFRIGRLEAGKTLRISFSGVFSVPSQEGQLAKGQVIRFRKIRPGAPWETAGTAAAGQRLRFAVVLDNPSWQPLGAHVRGQIRDVGSGQYARISIYTSVYGRAEEPLGEVVVSGAGDRPIRLRVVQRSTVLRDGLSRSRCHSGRVLRRLPDGLEKGGIDIADIGGFKPRDKCHGTGFIRVLTFDARVT